ncbi:hypothetical protein ACFWGD_03715 [Corynebacterium sp. NPDC060344]|uniref:hypothetical protein n=1 Tax=Corynebacterium sp. NPDC060344 TaxID=3347101 RepID=UPI0036642865
MNRVLPERLVRLLGRHPAVWVFRHEIRVWADLIRLLRRQRVVPPRRIPIPAVEGLWGIPGMMTVATIVELIAIELLLPWPEVRVVLALVSIYSLLILWSFIGQRVVYPHSVGPELILRHGRTIIARIDAAAVGEVLVVRDYAAEQHAVGGGVLTLSNGQGTNVRVALHAGAVPVETRPPTWIPWKKKPMETITEVALWADDPIEAVAAIRTARDQAAAHT